MTIDQAFNAITATYDDWMQRALLGYADLFRTAVDIIPYPADRPIQVLDLGAGTGIFSQHVLAAYPLAKFVLVDVADKMLDVARERFRSQAGQFRFEISDYRELVAQQEYDLVISSLSIHHLTDFEKRNLFHSIFKTLRSPGVFINVDQIRGETESLRNLYWNRWMKHVRRSGATAEQIQASINRRTEFDKEAFLTDQIIWLKESGFSTVDCVYKNYFLGVFLAAKGNLDDLSKCNEIFSEVSKQEKSL
ncbi:MAG: methyltransferase domain-containing protein [Leptolinea sp.]